VRPSHHKSLVTKIGVKEVIVTRDAVEMMGKFGASLIEETDEYKLVRVLNRFEMFVLKGDKSVAPHLEKEGFWEAWITAWVMNNVKQGSVFIDVGANTGYYGFLADSLGALVGFVEPNPPYVKMLNKSVRHLGLQDKCIVMPFALSDKNGFATLHVPHELHGSASLHEIDAKWVIHEETVETKTMDSIFGHSQKGDLDYFVKIDAEGAEEKILDGAENYLAAVKPVLILEYTPGAYGKDFLTKLNKYGRLAWIDHSGFEQLVTKENIIGHGDWLMLVVRPR
jgi:FkbM family methyltransferase